MYADCTSAQADLAAERETPTTCACGADDFTSTPAPAGVHTLTVCEQPDLRPDVKGCTTPTLVREFASRKAADARGVLATRAEHKRHCAVVNELRARGVLD